MGLGGLGGLGGWGGGGFFCCFLIITVGGGELGTNFYFVSIFLIHILVHASYGPVTKM